MNKGKCLIRLTILAAASVLLQHVSSASGDVWIKDFDAAVEKAKTENKKLLVDFSGSDWCGWCIKLDQEVFSKPEFIDEAGKQFIFVLLDFPRKEENIAKNPEALRKRNEELKTKFNVSRYPTVLLCNSKGEPFARTGYRQGGPTAYLKHLDKLQADKLKHDELLKKIEGTKGIERAKLLDQLIDATDASEQGGMLNTMQEIIQLDSDNAAGLKGKYELKYRLLEARQAVSERDFEKANQLYRKIVDEMKLTDELLQRVYVGWFEVKYYSMDRDGMVDCLEKAIAADSDSKIASVLKKRLKMIKPEESEKSGAGEE